MSQSERTPLLLAVAAALLGLTFLILGCLKAWRTYPSTIGQPLWASFMIAATLQIIIGLGALLASRAIERGRAGIREARYVAAASSLLMLTLIAEVIRPIMSPLKTADDGPLTATEMVETLGLLVVLVVILFGYRALVRRLVRFFAQSATGSAVTN